MAGFLPVTTFVHLLSSSEFSSYLGHAEEFIADSLMMNPRDLTFGHLPPPEFARAALAANAPDAALPAGLEDVMLAREQMEEASRPPLSLTHYHEYGYWRIALLGTRGLPSLPARLPPLPITDPFVVMRLVSPTGERTVTRALFTGRTMMVESVETEASTQLMIELYDRDRAVVPVTSPISSLSPSSSSGGFLSNIRAAVAEKVADHRQRAATAAAAASNAAALHVVTSGGSPSPTSSSSNNNEQKSEEGLIGTLCLHLQYYLPRSKPAYSMKRNQMNRGWYELQGPQWNAPLPKPDRPGMPAPPLLHIPRGDIQLEVTFIPLVPAVSLIPDYPYIAPPEDRSSAIPWQPLRETDHRQGVIYGRFANVPLHVEAAREGENKSNGGVRVGGVEEKRVVNEPISRPRTPSISPSAYPLTSVSLSGMCADPSGCIFACDPPRARILSIAHDGNSLLTII
jgi:hypothetical protein